MALPERFRGRLALPLIGAPMFPAAREAAAAALAAALAAPAASTTGARAR